MKRLPWLMVIMVIGLLTACSSEPIDILATPFGATPEPSAAVEPLDASRAEMAFVNANGDAPCGIGQTKWGFQIFQMGDYPGCTEGGANLTVLCLNGDGQWVADNVAEVSASEGAISFTSTGEGICGLFPAG